MYVHTYIYTNGFLYSGISIDTGDSSEHHTGVKLGSG